MSSANTSNLEFNKQKAGEVKKLLSTSIKKRSGNKMAPSETPVEGIDTTNLVPYNFTHCLLLVR